MSASLQINEIHLRVADLARSLLGWRQSAGTKLVVWRGASVLTLTLD